MSVSGLCEICQHREVEDSCSLCGKLVCERHYKLETGRCVKCEAEFGGDRPETVPEDEELPDGVDTYEF